MFFSLNKTSMKTEGVMNVTNKITEEVLPKPQITRPSKLLRKREITFTEPISANIPRMATANLEVGEEAEHDDLDEGVEQQNKASGSRLPTVS